VTAAAQAFGAHPTPTERGRMYHSPQRLELAGTPGVDNAQHQRSAEPLGGVAKGRVLRLARAGADLSPAIRIERHAYGPRVYLLGLRVHHGLIGCVLALLGTWRRERSLLPLGLMLVCTDRHDFPWSPREATSATRDRVGGGTNV
jgi:hypothetical protein